MTKPADSGQIAKARKKLSERAIERAREIMPTSNPDVFGVMDLAGFMAAFAASERQAVIEECCRAVCQACADGVPVQEKDSVITANGDPFWHYLSVGDVTFWAICDAAAIRSME